MPAKRVILLDRPNNAHWYRYVLWADVPSGNQIAYADPVGKSAYVNITPTELQAIRDGVVAEKVGQILTDSTSITAIQTELESRWNEWQTEVTNEVPFGEYGRSWNGTSWAASPGVPMARVTESIEGVPTFVALTPVSAFAANKFHFVLHNGASITTSQALLVKVRLVMIQPVITVVTGVQTGVWALQRRESPSTPPSGAGSITPALMDSGQALPANVTAFNAPGTSPAGGTVRTFNRFTPPADELALSTLNGPGMASLTGWGGQVVYRAGDVRQGKPLTLRPNQSMEVVQDATAGTGNCRVLCVFTVG